MEDVEIEQMLNYFDECRVEIRFVEMPDQPPKLVWSANFLSPIELSDRDDIVRQLERAIAEDPRIPAHTLDIRRSYTEWGASGAIQDVVVQVAGFFLEQGQDVAADMVKVGVGVGIERLWSRWKEARRDTRELLLGRESAEAEARRVIARAHSVSRDDLRLVDERRNLETGEWSFVFSLGTSTYSAVLRDARNGIVTTEVGRGEQLRD